MASIDSSAVRTSSYYLSKVRLMWLSRLHPLYRSLFRQVLREVCRYLADSLQRLICISPRGLATFNLATLEYSQSMPLPKVVITNYASYLQVDDWSVVFYSGVAETHIEPTVYLIAVEDASVRACQLSSLRHKRRHPAMIAVGGKVYVFGSGTFLYATPAPESTTGESLLLSTPTAWELLPGTMATPVESTSPCEHCQRIYLYVTTGRTQVFDIAAQQYCSGLALALQPYNSPVVCWRVDDRAIVFMSNCDAEVDLRRSTSWWRNKRPVNFDMVSMPIVRGGSVFWCGVKNVCYRLERKKGRCVLEQFGEHCRTEGVDRR